MEPKKNSEQIISIIFVIIFIIAFVYSFLYIKSNKINNSTSPQETINDLNNPTTGPSSLPEAELPIKNVDINLKSKCAEDGNRFFENNKNESNTKEKQIWFNPQYHFNTRLNTCLIYISYNKIMRDPNIDELSTGNFTSNTLNINTIIDIYSNQAIIQSDILNTLTSVNNIKQNTSEIVNYPLYSNIPNLDGNTFLSQSKILMNE